ncbi:MAG: hypothetical protein KBT21_05495 [Treponema sp.]|nr:hypothetical protein [Candidatus Treponema merdequi]
MKFRKGILFLILTGLLSLPVFAQDTKADISYMSAPIYKILDSTNHYVVMYGKYGAQIGTVTIPKKWAKWQKDTPRKLTIRELPRKMSPYITVVKKDNNFLKVMLTVPTDHNNRIWGIADNSKVDQSEPDSIELELR